MPHPYQRHSYDGTTPEYEGIEREPDGSQYNDAPKPTGALSGSLQLVLAAGVTAKPTQAQSVVRWNADEKFPSALSLIVNVKGDATNSNASPFASELALLAQCSGNAGGHGAELAGVLRLTYGFRDSVRILEADLRSGTYQLPPCSTCTVEALAYLNGPLSVQVAAAAVPGRTDTPARLVNSFRTTLNAGESATEKVPFGARWVSMSGGAPSVVGNGPQLALVQGTRGPAIIQDYVSGTFVGGGPGQAVELANRDDVTITNNGTAQAVITVRFYLEP